MPKKQSKKHNPNKQTKQKAKKKVKAGGIVSSMVSIDDVLRKSEILKPFISDNSLNHENIDNFIKDRVDSLIENFSSTSELSIKLKEVIINHIEISLKSEKFNNIINEFINDKIKRLSYETK